MGFVDLSLGSDNIDFGFSSFLELRPSERPTLPLKIWELSDQGFNYGCHWKGLQSSIKPIGIYQLKDLIITRPAGMMINRLLGYNCDTALVAASTIPIEDNLFHMSPKNKIVIEEDVLIADGVSIHIFGHWIVDYLPRFAIAKGVLKEKFQELKILLPHYAPNWAIDLLKYFFGINRDHIIQYNPDHDIVLCKNAILPSYCYTDEFFFHSYLKEFYGTVGSIFQRQEATRKILISRSSVAMNRKFLLRDFFEQEATKRGYEIVRPENLSIAEQIKVFAEAKIVIGEHGSGMHNAVFCREGTIVGCIGFWNAVQLHIGYLMNHKNVYLSKNSQWPTDENNHEFSINCDQDDIVQFLDKIDSLTINKMNFDGINPLFR